MTDNIRNKREHQLGGAKAMHQLFATKYSYSIHWHIGIIQSTTRLQERHVATALKLLAHNQEALQMRILPLDYELDNPTDFKFQPIIDPYRIDFEVIRMKSTDGWPNVISNAHILNRIDTTNGPLWRFILGEIDTKETINSSLHAYEYVLLLKMHHSISDGVSASDLMCRQFLPILSALANGREAENMFPILPQVKSQEEIFLSKEKQQSPIPWYLNVIANMLRWKNWLFKQPETPLFKFSDENISSEESPQGQVCVPKVFRQEISESVINAAKINCVTVHTVLLVAGAMAFSRTAKAAGIKLPESFQQMWLINLRKYLDLRTPQPLGCLASITVTTHSSTSDCDIDTFWKSCKNMYLAVKNESEKEKVRSTIGLVKYWLPDIAECTFETATKELGLECLIALSNLGSLSKDQEADLSQGSTDIQMTEQFFTLSGPVTFTPMFQFLITFRGRFMWNILHHSKKVSRQFIDAYYYNLEDVMISFCKKQ